MGTVHMRLLPTLLALACCCMSRTSAIKVVVSPGHTECISETIGAEHFEMYGARLDGRVLIKGNSQYYIPFITVKVYGPSGEQLWQQVHAYSEAHFNVGAKTAGAHKVCFENPWESRTDAIVDLVYFTLAHLRGGGPVRIPKGTQESRDTEVAHQEHLDDVRRTILQMAEFMEVTSGSLKYFQRKLERHKHTVDSNNRRTLWYSLLEASAVLTVTGVQVYTIMKFFAKGRIFLSV